jgi:hypothetical protein
VRSLALAAVLWLVALAPARGASVHGSDSVRIARACRQIYSDDPLRVRGEFGEFYGTVSRAGPTGLEGLTPWRDSRGRVISPPSEPRLAWESIRSVDRRGGGWRKGAIVGFLAVGALGGYVGYVAENGGLFEANYGTPLETAGGTAFGFFAAGLVGGVIGGGVGALFPAWIHVYERPHELAR